VRTGKRPSVFELTDTEQAIVDLWDELAEKLTQSQFENGLGLCRKRLGNILTKRMEIELARCRERPEGRSSLGVARGRRRMVGTK